VLCGAVRLQWAEAYDYPAAELLPKAYAAGVLSAMWPKEWGGTPPEGVDKPDPFHDLVQ
jgi:hypothetical protein